MRPKLSNKDKNKPAKKPKPGFKSKQNKTKQAKTTPKVAAVSEQRRAKINDAIAESKKLGLPNCIGCGSRSHRYSEFFVGCDSQCPYCGKSFKKEDTRHFSIKCNKRPEEREKCIEILQAMEKRR